MEACPPLQQGSTWVTTFTLPEAYQEASKDTAEAVVDEDGDLLIDRQSGVISTSPVLVNLAAVLAGRSLALNLDNRDRSPCTIAEISAPT